MSSTLVSAATGSSARTCQDSNIGAQHRHSKSTSTINGVPKRQSNNRHHSSQYYQKQGNQSPMNNYSSSNNNNTHYTHNGPRSAAFQRSHSDNESFQIVGSDSTPKLVPTTPPRLPTPVKSQNHFANDGINNCQQPNDKKSRKRRTQKRPKDLNTAAAAKADYPISTGNPIPPAPQTAKPFGTPGKHYAGPTFHHSPAPSALPLPSFFSKSVPSTPNGPSLSTMMSSSDSSDESDSTPSGEDKKEESPLAKLFRADSEERAAKKAQRYDNLEHLHDDNPFKSRSTSNLPTSKNTGFQSDIDSSPGTPGNRSGGGVDLLFSMDSVNRASSPEIAVTEQEVKKRRDKAIALKEILLQHAPTSPEQQKRQPRNGMPFPSSPSPRPRIGERQLSPEVPFSRNLAKAKTHPPAGKSPSGTPTKSFGSRIGSHNENVPASESPKRILSRQQDNSASKDPKAIEDYLRWALKMDTPSATGVRG